MRRLLDLCAACFLGKLLPEILFATRFHKALPDFPCGFIIMGQSFADGMPEDHFQGHQIIYHSLAEENILILSAFFPSRKVWLKVSWK